jgi:hypothetical protein
VRGRLGLAQEGAWGCTPTSTMLGVAPPLLAAPALGVAPPLLVRVLYLLQLEFCFTSSFSYTRTHTNTCCPL